MLVNFVVLGTTASRLIHVDGGTGSNSLYVNDSAFPGGERYVIDPAVRIPALGFAVDYVNIRNLDFKAAAGPNVIDIRKTVAPGQNLISTGLGDNVIAMGHDGVLKGVGLVQVSAQFGGNTSLVIDDARYAGATTYTMTDTEVNVARLPGLRIHYEGEIRALTLDTSAGDDTVNVQATPGGATTINTGNSRNTIEVGRSSGSLTINGGGGRNALYVGSYNELGGFGHVAVHGSGNDYLSVSDANYLGGDTYTLTASSLAVAGLPRFRLDYDGLDTLAITTGRGDDIFDILSTAPGTFSQVTSESSNVAFHIGDGGDLGLINRLEVRGGPRAGVRILDIDDSAFAGEDTYTFGAGAMRLSRNPGFELEFMGSSVFDQVCLRTGRANDTLLVVGTPSATTIRTGDGDNTIRVVGAGGLPPRRAPATIITGSGANTIMIGDGHLDYALSVTIAGGPGSNTLVVDDSAYLSGDRYTITATAMLVAGLPDFQVSYVGMTSLILDASAGPDTINVESTAAGTATVLNGGTAANTFSFSPTAKDLGMLAGPVAVQSTSDRDTITLFDNGLVDDYTVSDFATQVNRLGTVLTYSGASPDGGFSGTIRLFTDQTSTVTDDTVYATLEVNPPGPLFASKGSDKGTPTPSSEDKFLSNEVPPGLVSGSGVAVREKMPGEGSGRVGRSVDEAAEGLAPWRAWALEDQAAAGHPCL